MVIDASAVLDLLLGSGAAESVSSRIEKTTLHAPELIDLEVLQILRRYRLHEGLGRSRAEEALADFSALRIHRHRHRLYVARIWELHENLTAYDAAYVVLAEVLQAPLLTSDGKLARSSGHRAQIDLVT
jgi:predicted nucleic acid-binding protein